MWNRPSAAPRDSVTTVDLIASAVAAQIVPVHYYCPTINRLQTLQLFLASCCQLI